MKGGKTMATYVILVKYTQRGIENIKQSPARLDEAKKASKAIGVQLKEFYLAMGRYDIVIVLEAPDDETVAKWALTVSSKGSVTTETLRVFTEEEYRKIIGAIP
jgi:uncharacterized protein with GYD domain